MSSYDMAQACLDRIRAELDKEDAGITQIQRDRLVFWDFLNAIAYTPEDRQAVLDFVRQRKGHVTEESA
jgi:hypothetical protein